MIYEDTTDWKSRYEELRKLKTVCLSEKIIIYSSLSNINGSLDSLNEDNKAKVYILYGSDKMKKAVFQEASKSGIRNKTWILVHTSSRNLRFLQFKKGFGNEFTEIDGRFLFIYPNVGRDVEFEQHYLKSDNSNSKTQFANGKKMPIEAKGSNSGDKVTQKKGRKKFRYSSVGFVRNAVMVFTSYWLNQLQAYKMQYQENLCVNSTKISNKLRNFNYVPYLKELNFKGLSNESIQIDNNGNVKNFVYNIFAINPTNIIRKSYIKVNKRNSTNNYRAGIKTTLKIRLFANWSSANILTENFWPHLKIHTLIVHQFALQDIRTKLLILRNLVAGIVLNVQSIISNTAVGIQNVESEQLTQCQTVFVPSALA